MATLSVMMLVMMWFLLWLSLTIVQPDRNIAHRRQAQGTPGWCLDLDLDVVLQPAGRLVGLSGLSQQGEVCEPPAGRLQCGCAELQLGLQSPT